MNSRIVDDNNFDTADVGGKANNLFRMRQNGVNVPRLFCVPHSFFDERDARVAASHAALINASDYTGEKSLRNAAAALAETAEKVRLDESAGQEITRYIDGHFPAGARFSVRSSASCEDALSGSFAGRFETFLNVKREDVLACVERCALSRYSEGVLKYCGEVKIRPDSFRMNVIVQEMVDADCSGVLFTANPRGLLNETVAVCGKGTGDNVVEDKTPVTAYYYSNTDKVYYYEKQGNSPELSRGVFDTLIDTAEEIKGLFGRYLDIEYAVKDGELFILQARPITTIDDANPVILDNSNIVESYPGVTLPLSDSFVREAYYGVFRGLASRCLKNDKLLAGYDENLRNMVGSANGRMYYKISNWYNVLSFLPMSKKIIPVWQDMMGVSSKEIHTSVERVPAIRKLLIYRNCLSEALKIQKGMKKLNGEFAEVTGFFNREFQPGMATPDLIRLFNATSMRILRNWDITLLNDIYTFVFTGLLKSLFKKQGIENAEAYTNRVIAGVADLESMKPVKALTKIAVTALENSRLDELKALRNDEETEAYIANKNNETAALMKEYIRVYGDRSLEELKLESMTFRTSPLLLAVKLLEYAGDPVKLKKINTSLTADDKREPAGAKSGYFSRKLTAYCIAKARLGIGNREVSRLNRSRVYGIAREVFLAIGRHMREEGRLDAERDIFYLYKNEAFEDSNRDFRETVKRRKAEYAMYTALPAYSRLVFSGEPFNKRHGNINAVRIDAPGGLITGTPCSNGIAEGEVLVIDSPQTAENAKDRILVTKMTDPGWVFLITMAKGIIAEKGSLLSHTAIISRELGVPSIVGVKKATGILRTGDTVRMNGGTGSIEVVSGHGG